MSIKVVCAAAGSENDAGTEYAVEIERRADLRAQQLVLTLAAKRSAELGEPVWVRFR